MAGVEASGFVIKTLQEIKDEVEQEQRDTISQGLNQTATSALTQVNAPHIAKLAELWEVAQATYNCLNPDAANDACLENVSAITGTTRNVGSKARIDDGVGGGVTYNVDAGTFLAGTLIASAIGDPTVRFLNELDVVNLGPGAADIAVPAIAESNGEQVVIAGQLAVIAEPISGWNSVLSDVDTDPIGQALENNPELRLRREEEVRSAGSANVDAVRADLLLLDGVTDARCFENDTDIIDAAGRPAHSLECVVLGGVDAEIANRIFLSKCGGIGALTIGTPVLVVVVDTQGNPHNIVFARPVDKPIAIIVNITGTAAVSEVEAALIATVEAPGGIGRDVQFDDLLCAVKEVGGADNVTDLLLAFAPATPIFSEDLTIEAGERATLASPDITVVVTPPTP